MNADLQNNFNYYLISGLITRIQEKPNSFLFTVKIKDSADEIQQSEVVVCLKKSLENLELYKVGDLALIKGRLVPTRYGLQLLGLMIKDYETQA